jgi:hypothetical protein
MDPVQDVPQRMGSPEDLPEDLPDPGVRGVQGLAGASTFEEPSVPTSTFNG